MKQHNIGTTILKHTSFCETASKSVQPTESVMYHGGFIKMYRSIITVYIKNTDLHVLNLISSPTVPVKSMGLVKFPVHSRRV